MTMLELFLIAVGLSMDAFAVAVCKGLAMPKSDWKKGGLIALFFGGFQALMSFLGYVAGRWFEGYITAVDHWVAFLLLGFIGGRMVLGSFKKEEAAEACEPAFSLRELLVLSIATSIDALAVGISFAFRGVAILPSVAFIGGTTFCLSLVGVAIGHGVGGRMAKKAETLGGLILIGIGLKILLSDLLVG